MEVGCLSLRFLPCISDKQCKDLCFDAKICVLKIYLVALKALDVWGIQCIHCSTSWWKRFQPISLTKHWDKFCQFLWQNLQLARGKTNQNQCFLLCFMWQKFSTKCKKTDFIGLSEIYQLTLKKCSAKAAQIQTTNFRCLFYSLELGFKFIMFDISWFSFPLLKFCTINW